LIVENSLQRCGSGSGEGHNKWTRGDKPKGLREPQTGTSHAEMTYRAFHNVLHDYKHL